MVVSGWGSGEVVSGVGVSVMSGAAGWRGSEKKKVDPCPMVERTAMAPPMRDTREWQMARPRPVPPYLRHVLSSAWGERRGEGGGRGWGIGVRKGQCTCGTCSHPPGERGGGGRRE